MTKFQDLIYTTMKIVIAILLLLTIIEGTKYIGTIVSSAIDSIDKRFEIVNTKITEAIKSNIQSIDKVNKNIDKVRDDIEEQFITYELKQESKIKEVLDTIEEKQYLIERKLQQVNVLIINNTIQAGGSGVTLKYKGKYYILTAGHMLDNVKDELILMENGNEIGKLKVIKWDFIGLEGVESPNDLLLCKPENSELFPQVYTELAEIEPQTPERIYHVGNPSGVEDLVSDCRIITYENKFMYIHGTSFFGSSGCGLYNKNGYLVGILSHGRTAHFNGEYFSITGCVRLDVIKKFLHDAEVEGLLD